MSVCFKKFNHFNVEELERDRLYHIVEEHNFNFKLGSVLKASRRMDQIILYWYQQQKKKS